MFALISQLPPDSPRCRAPPRRGGRCVPAEPRRAGEPTEGTGNGGRAGMERGLERATPETTVGPDAAREDDAGKAAGTEKRSQGPGCATSLGNAGRGKRPDPDPHVTASPPSTPPPCQ